MEHAAEGLFDAAAVTTWNRGGTAEVIWASGANHRGTKKKHSLVISNERRNTVCLFLFQEDMLTASAKSLLEASLRSQSNASEMGICHLLGMTRGYGRRAREVHKQSLTPTGRSRGL